MHAQGTSLAVQQHAKVTTSLRSFDHAESIFLPGHKYTFGVVKAAQARGDFRVLLDRERRALRVHLGADVKGGLEKLSAAVMSALGYKLGEAIWSNVS